MPSCLLSVTVTTLGRYSSLLSDSGSVRSSLSSVLALLVSGVSIMKSVG